MTLTAAAKEASQEKKRQMQQIDVQSHFQDKIKLKQAILFLLRE